MHIPKWIKGRVPEKSGNYAVRYNGFEGRDDYTAVGKYWYNTGKIRHPEEVEWDANSFRELGE